MDDGLFINMNGQLIRSQQKRRRRENTDRLVMCGNHLSFFMFFISETEKEDYPPGVKEEAGEVLEN